MVLFINVPEIRHNRREENRLKGETQGLTCKTESKNCSVIVSLFVNVSMYTYTELCTYKIVRI